MRASAVVSPLHRASAMRSIIVGSVASLVLTTGCLGLSDSQNQSEVGGGTASDDGCKIEGSQIGREGQELHLGSTTVTFHDWIAKPGEPGEYLGFSLTIAGAPYDHFVVKAGTQKFIGDGEGWMHPAGASGNGAAISNVDFCECEPPAPPACDNPDGCDDGGGGGDDGGDGTIL